MTATRSPLSNQRWHFQHGPIDLVLGAEGATSAVSAAHEHAWQRFQTVLSELVAELPLLRAPVSSRHVPCGSVARKMLDACRVFRPQFITPMAAVAGAVADEIIASYRRAGVRKAWVNNGGDIAIHLAPGASEMRLAVVVDPQMPRFCVSSGLMQHDGVARIAETSEVRGVATSGWNGRSFSFGIADAVTVLASSAARADAAATIIANAVDVVCPLVARAPASSLKDDSDLGDRWVTVNVPALPRALIETALSKGLMVARTLQASGLIVSALLQCQGRTRLLGEVPRAPQRLAEAQPQISADGGARLRYAATMENMQLVARSECAA